MRIGKGNKTSTGLSPWVLHYNGSSCNGCDIEVLATFTPRFDVERFGILNTGNPKHADILLITGGINNQNIPVLQQLYTQMLEPKVVVACGVCACSGGIFRECYNTVGGADSVIPVDVYAPGCAVRPEAIIDAVIEGVEILERRRRKLRDGLPIDAGTLASTPDEGVAAPNVPIDSIGTGLVDPTLPRDVRAGEILRERQVFIPAPRKKAESGSSEGDQRG